MSKILDEVLAANAKYAENVGDKGTMPLPERPIRDLDLVWMPALIWLNTPVWPRATPIRSVMLLRER